MIRMIRMASTLAALGLAMVLFAPAALAADADGDGVSDSADNCTAVANADQIDGDGVVMGSDVSAFRQLSGKPAGPSGQAR